MVRGGGFTEALNIKTFLHQGLYAVIINCNNIYKLIQIIETAHLAPLIIKVYSRGHWYTYCLDPFNTLTAYCCIVVYYLLLGLT